MKQIIRAWLLAAALLAAMPARPVERDAAAGAVREIVLRHELLGAARDALRDIVVRFNAELGGAARITLQNVQDLTPSERKQLPQMALLDVDDSLDFFDVQPRFKPLAEVMAQAHQRFSGHRLFPLAVAAVSDAGRRVQALPIGLSMPVLLWNKDAFKRAGLDPETAPRTWRQVQSAAASLFDSGQPCPLTSSRFAWVNLENLSTQHGEPIVVRQRGGGERAALNELVEVKHVALLSSWYKSDYFRYFGAGTAGDTKFLAGECAMLTGASVVYREALREGLHVGAAPLPYYDDVPEATPGEVSADGSALWVLAGFPAQDYAVVARLVGYLLRPEVQQAWVGSTGYLPMTAAALDAYRAGGPPAVVDAAARRLEGSGSAGPVLDYARRSRMRAIIGDEIDAVWANRKPAKEALDRAMERINSSDAETQP